MGWQPCSYLPSSTRLKTDGFGCSLELLFPKANFNESKRRNPYVPEVGDQAPDFELKSHLEKDKKVRLSDFRGKNNVVLAFYPLAWTPV